MLLDFLWQRQETRRGLLYVDCLRHGEAANKSGIPRLENLRGVAKRSFVWAQRHGKLSRRRASQCHSESGRAPSDSRKRRRIVEKTRQEPMKYDHKSFNCIDSWVSWLCGCVVLRSSTLEYCSFQTTQKSEVDLYCSEIFGIKMIYVTDSLRRHLYSSKETCSKCVGSFKENLCLC